MKKLKFALLFLFAGAFFLTSCENEEIIIDDQVITEESLSIVTALDKLSNQFDQNGNLSDTNNPVGNVIFDFCFDFVYPITLSFNNGSTVAVTDLNDLVGILISSTDQLFINGVAFPFDVERYNEDSNAIEIVSINNEAEFADLILSCNFFNDISNCICTQEYYPVCIEITDENGMNFIISYPNPCYAACYGFTDADFIDDCEEEDYYDYNNNFDCFSLNYPLDIMLEDGSIVNIDSDEEFANTMYNQFMFDFVYPISVTLGEDDSIVTLNSVQDFETLLNDCFGGNTGIDCEECEDEPIDPVCVLFIDENNETVITTFPNFCTAECNGFTEDDLVDCETVGTSCTEDDIMDYLSECNIWSFNIDDENYTYILELNNIVVEVLDGNGDFIEGGTWELYTVPTSLEVLLVINTASDTFSTVLSFTDCENGMEPTISSSNTLITNIQHDCD